MLKKQSVKNPKNNSKKNQENPQNDKAQNSKLKKE
jgi:hypothetical protein